jgi:xylulokinase
MICLGIGNADTVMVPVNSYIPSSHHQIFPYPASSPTLSSQTNMAMIAYKDAALARSFVRDIYCNASWDVFNQLVNVIPPGGSIGLDDKLFSYFYPHGEAGVWQGISRFQLGQRVTEYSDLRANPRAILESQCK